MALVEAMISGVPCIASDIPPFREVSNDGKFVVLFEKANSYDLANLILSELDSLKKDDTQKRSFAAQEFAIRKFDINVHIKKLHQLYLECLESS